MSVKTYGSFTDLKVRRTKCTALTAEVSAPSFHELLEDIKTSDVWFNFVLHECTDIIDNKWLGMIIIFYGVKNSKVVDILHRLLSFIGGRNSSL